MRTVEVEIKTTWRYEIDPDDEQSLETDGVPWADWEIKDFFIEQAAQDIVNGDINNDIEAWKSIMSARIIE